MAKWHKNKSLVKCIMTCILLMGTLSFSYAQTWQDYFNKAIDNAQNGDMKGAIVNFEEALKFKEMPVEQKAQAYFYKGAAHGALGEVAEAIASMSGAIEADPNFADAYLQRGILYNNGTTDRLSEQALADLDVATNLLPNNKDAWLGRGIAQSNLGKTKEAVKSLTKAIDLDGTDVEAIRLRGVCYRQLKKFELAMQDLNTAVRMQPTNSVCYLERGILYSLQKNYEYAIRDYTQAIVYNPGNNEALFNRGIAHSNIDNHQAAIADFSKVIQNTPDDRSFLSDAYFNRALELIFSGKEADGCYDFKKAADLGHVKSTEAQLKFCGKNN